MVLSSKVLRTLEQFKVNFTERGLDRSRLCGSAPLPASLLTRHFAVSQLPDRPLLACRWKLLGTANQTSRAGKEPRGAREAELLEDLCKRAQGPPYRQRFYCAELLTPEGPKASQSPLPRLWLCSVPGLLSAELSDPSQGGAPRGKQGLSPPVPFL